MDEKLEKILVEKYPKLFAQYHGDPQKTCMSYGIMCGDGWFKLIDELCEKLSKYPEIEAAQIKEKFGSLRFYIDSNNTKKEKLKEVYDIIYNAERQSIKTCETCGKPGKVRGGNWLRTICDNCDSKIN